MMVWKKSSLTIRLKRTLGLSEFARKLGRTIISLSLNSLAEQLCYSAVSGTKSHDRRRLTQSRYVLNPKMACLWSQAPRL